MKILLTGAAGRIGREVLKDLRSRKHKIIPFDILCKKDIKGFVTEDLANLSKIKSLSRDIDCIVHLAAIPDHNTRDNKRIWDTNSTGIFNILEAEIRNDVKKIVYALIQAGDHEIFNIGSTHTCSSIESLELINRFYPDVKKLKNTDGFLSDKHAALYSPYKAKVKLGFLPKHEWKEYVEAAKGLDKIAL